MLKVLVVDDEKLVRRGLISMMPWEKHGMEVTGEAMNGLKALELMEAEQADVVFTDLMMPEMSGFALMEELKLRFPETSVVVLSCHEEFSFAQQAIRNGAVDYIVKNDLEADAMDEVLQRIAEGIRKRGKLHSEEKPLSEGSSPFYAGVDSDGGGIGNPCVNHKGFWRGAWEDLGWVYDDMQFDRALNVTAAQRPPLSELKGTLFPVLLKAGYLMLSLEHSLHWISLLERNDSWELWLRILREEREHLRAPLMRGKHAPEVVNGIRRAVEYMHAKEELDFSQNEAADAANMSRSYFSQSFKSITGKAFQDYVRELRLYKARQLLLQTDKPIYAIAQQVGFKDEKYFSRLFQQESGMLPSAYRNQNPFLSDSPGSAEGSWFPDPSSTGWEKR